MVECRDEGVVQRLQEDWTSENWNEYQGARIEVSKVALDQHKKYENL